MVKAPLGGAKVRKESLLPPEGSGPEGRGEGRGEHSLTFWLMEPVLKNTGYACQGHHGLSQQPVQGCSCRWGRAGAGSRGEEREEDWATSSWVLRPGSKPLQPPHWGEWGDLAPPGALGWVSDCREVPCLIPSWSQCRSGVK